MKKNNQIFQLIIIPLFVIFTSCNTDKTKVLDNVIGTFDIHEDYMALTYFKNNIGSIYYYSLIDNTFQKLTNPTKGFDNSPTFSNDGKKIAYINYESGDFSNCFINVLDIETKTVDTLFNESQIINMCFSNSNEFIFFTKADVITNYSPIARKAPHGIDIFKVNIGTKEVSQITNLNEYSMQSLKNTYSDSLLAINIFGKGFCTVSTHDRNIKTLEMKNNPRPTVSSYYYPIALNKDSCLFEAPYEIYKYNFEQEKAEKLIRSNSHFKNVIIDKDWQNITFMNSTGVFCYNLSNKKTRKIKFKFQEYRVGKGESHP